jgi:hypothetical protein
LYYPDSGYSIKEKRAFVGSSQFGNNASQINFGNAGDGYGHDVTYWCDTGKAAELITYLTTSARSNAFDITTGDYGYPLGIDGGSGASAISCKLASNIIRIVNVSSNRFEITFSVMKV